MPARLTQNQFIERANEIHNNKYDYSLVKYNNCSTKVKIICKEHGVFEQTPHMHLQGQNCSKCGRIILSNKLKKTNEDFKRMAVAVHGSQYDYSLVEYNGNKIKVKIICKKCNDVFEQKPNEHLSGHGCRLHSKTRQLNNDTFENKARLVHGGRYDYSLVEYKNIRTKVKIICKEHGVFEQMPNDHLNCGAGCPNSGCSGYRNTKLTQNEFIGESNEVHKNKYDYSKFKYTDYETKGIIICNRHGEFLQTPHAHLAGAGCPKCNSSKGEETIRWCLIKNKLEFEEQKKFKECKNKLPLIFDFCVHYDGQIYLIEFDGKQHFEPIEAWNGEEGFLKIKENDRIKNEFAESNGIRLIRIPYTKFDEINKIISRIIIG